MNSHPDVINGLMNHAELKATITDSLSRMPDWIRHDLAIRDPAMRLRAEETLAAMIAAAIVGEPDAQIS